MKIYTKTGDTGETSLFAGGRTSKDDVRLHAYGTVDELNSILGIVIAAKVDKNLTEQLKRIQIELFSVGADLATPLDDQVAWIRRVDEDMTRVLETEIDTFELELEPLKNFILPGGTPAAANLHLARTVCRRAERWIVSLADSANPFVLTYINRLSDWLFIVARVENTRAGIEESIWESQ